MPVEVPGPPLVVTAAHDAPGWSPAGPAGVDEVVSTVTRALEFESREVWGRVEIAIPSNGYVGFDGRVRPEGGRLVVVNDQEVPRPRAGLELRAEGLWAEMICETPLEHWSYGLEAFGLALDDPETTEALGDRVPVGWDLEWEATAAPVAAADGSGFEHAGIVHGEVLIGSTRLAVDGRGHRTHSWWVRPRSTRG